MGSGMSYATLVVAVRYSNIDGPRAVGEIFNDVSGIETSINDPRPGLASRAGETHARGAAEDAFSACR